MKFLPIENITFKTRLKEEEIVERLSYVIEPEKTIRFDIFSSVSTKPYEGEIIGGIFSMKSIIGNQNYFVPRIDGIIENHYDGINIKVKISLQVFLIIFFCYWWIGVGIACVGILLQFFDDFEFYPASLIPIVMLIFIYGIAMVRFKIESKKSKKDLQRIFEAEIFEY